jgi:hypothetical protein
MPAFTEAPTVWTVRYLSGAGFECQLTIRGENGKEVLEKAGVAMDYLLSTGIKPIAGTPAAAPAAPQAPAGTSGPAAPNPAWCSIHGCEMQKHEKDGKYWYSHRLESGSYCKGK